MGYTYDIFSGGNKNTAALEVDRFEEDQNEIDLTVSKIVLEQMVKEKVFEFIKISS